MKTCSKECAKYPCCDFCRHKIPYMFKLDGKMVDGGPSGCSLHIDKQHQDIAIGCGYCPDFYCFNVPLEEGVHES